MTDNLDKLIAGAGTEVRTSKVAIEHIENCPKCSGRGNWRPGYPCFKCNGTGRLTFKTPSAQRAKSRASKIQKKVDNEEASIAAFKAAHAAEYAWLVASSPNFEFASKMLANLRRWGSLTENQLAACTRSAQKLAASKQATQASAPIADAAGVDRLKLAFDTAIANSQAKGRNFKWPRITIGGVVISPAGDKSKNAGALYVKEAGTYLGKIQDGRFLATGGCTEEQEKRVLAFIADPKAAAQAYGIETGVCCICNATLTNKASIQIGIGPVCATKFGW